ncbi:hypothetical protein CC78DRAFT_622465 [Lojkania enalia]|uniref:Zn(2)-C6 fungal-type domain-containing protein n=1 Tax=Lojkania enalia TaxID=147567 RepID=A0A9P4JZ51_9PLEO|nr:hypothetical protein CC78DRAFT_622465 [Didymosphaeria enalia]
MPSPLNSNRRNGKPAPCEPCRKNKTKCDHTYPKCNRCHQRGIAERCFYNPAPLTKRREMATNNDAGRENRASRNSAKGRRASYHIPDSRTASNPEEQRLPTPSLSQSEMFADAVAAQTYRTGYLGPTSYAAILPKDDECPSPPLDREVSRKFHSWAIGRECCQCLKIPADIQAGEFHNLFTGDYICKEILGLFLSTAGKAMAYDILPHSWNDNHRRVQGSKFANEMMQLSTTCLVLWNLVSPVNDIMIWMFFENLFFTSMLCGYNAPPTWRRVGELATHIYALGIHKESKGSTLPLFVLETRRRIFYAPYTIDKTFSTFLGRPLRMSKRHTDKCYWRASYIRLRYMSARIREEILDLALTKLGDSAEPQLLEISFRNRETWDSLPPHFHYWPRCWEEIPSGTCYMLVVISLHYFYNEFMIQIFLDHQPLTLNVDFLRVCMDLLSTVLTLGQVHDRMYDVHRDFLLTAILYGIPSGSILATALREQHQTGQQFPPSISRSEIIRNLSILISHLNAATKTFTKIIDTVLDPKPVPTLAVSEELALNLDSFSGPILEGFDEFDNMLDGMNDGIEWGSIG